MTSATKARHVAIIGAGITGLAAAHRLISADREIRVTMLEAADRAGGIIQTVRRDGFMVELGPDSFITNKSGAVQLCDEIGFSDQLISTETVCRRSLVLRNGKPLPVPDGFMLMAPAKPWAVMTSPILSLAGRLRLLSEVFVRPNLSGEDESLSSFVRRRFGREAFDRLVQPLVGGIYTSDPEKLSLQATLPRFPQLERQYGSVIRGTLRQARESVRKSSPDESGSGARYGLFATPRQGLSQLVDAVTAACVQSGRVAFEFRRRVRSISQKPDSGPSSPTELNEGEGTSGCSAAGWTVLLDGETDHRSYDAVIVTLPTYAAAAVLPGESFAKLRAALRAIEYASSAIVVSAHRLSDFSHPLDAFGLVIPDIEQREVLAVSFSSRKFTGRAPEGLVLLRTFVGGAVQADLLQRSDAEILGMVKRELQSILGMKQLPMFADVVRYERAMPQYHVGHLQRVAAIENCLENHPGLLLAGSAYYGVGIPDSISSGRQAAESVLSVLL